MTRIISLILSLTTATLAWLIPAAQALTANPLINARSSETETIVANPGIFLVDATANIECFNPGQQFVVTLQFLRQGDPNTGNMQVQEVDYGAIYHSSQIGVVGGAQFDGPIIEPIIQYESYDRGGGRSDSVLPAINGDPVQVEITFGVQRNPDLKSIDLVGMAALNAVGPDNKSIVIRPAGVSKVIKLKRCPDYTPSPQPPPQGKPVIICDPAEPYPYCIRSIPEISAMFQNVVNTLSYPVICSKNDPRPGTCVNKQIALGPRYFGIPPDIKPDIRPGECVVQEDSTFKIYEYEYESNVANFPTLEAQRHESKAVEISWCEVDELYRFDPNDLYPEVLVNRAPAPGKAGSIAPPDLSNLNGFNTKINAGAVFGKICRGFPGDPYWADDCSCACDGDICGNDYCFNGGVCVPITRHDIAITSPLECCIDYKHDLPIGHLNVLKLLPGDSFCDAQRE